MQECKVNILGSEYEIRYRKRSEDQKLEDVGGYTDPYTKKIVIGLNEDDVMNTGNMEGFYKHVLRHEITHAFLHESGLWFDSHSPESWGTSEEITDWIALQCPKMFKAFQETGAL